MIKFGDGSRTPTIIERDHLFPIEDNLLRSLISSPLARIMRADGAAPEEPVVFPGGRDSAGFGAGSDVHLERGVPAGEEANCRHAPGGGRGPFVPPAGGVGRRTGGPGALLQQNDGQGGRGAVGDRRAGAAQDGRTGEDPQNAVEFGEDGVDQTTGGDGGARNQQSAVRHPDVRAPDAARHTEAGIRGSRRDGRTVADDRAGEQAVRRTGEESADVFAPGAEPARAAGSEHGGAPRGATGEAQAGDAEYRVEGEPGGGVAGSGLRREPDPAGDSGADGERLGGDAQGGHTGGEHGIRPGQRTRNRAGEGQRIGNSARRPAAHLRPVLHDQGRSEPDGSWPGGGGGHYRAACGRNHRPVEAGRRDGVPGSATGDGGSGGGGQALSGQAQAVTGSNGRITW